VREFPTLRGRREAAVGGSVMVGSTSVTIAGMPAARQGDLVVEAAAPNQIASGAPLILIG